MEMPVERKNKNGNYWYMVQAQNWRSMLVGFQKCKGTWLVVNGPLDRLYAFVSFLRDGDKECVQSKKSYLWQMPMYWCITVDNFE